MNTAMKESTWLDVADTSELRRIFADQEPTALRWRESTYAERRARIERLKATVLAYRQDIIEAGFADFGKPATEVELTEILPVIAEANDALRRLKGWMKPRKVWPSRMMVGTQGYIQVEPKGRVLIISPWNYPINLSLGPLVSALAAGNTAILKPSEMTPHASAILRRIIEEAFAENEVAVVEGAAPIAQALLELPFNHIFFTGSPAVGRIVMVAAAKHLASVTLELGGKSPTIIDESADLALAARTVLWAKFTNDGQTCIAPDHVYVHASCKDDFIKHCREALEAVYGQETERMQSPFLARIVNERHTDRVKALLDDALQRGAKVLAGGQYDAAKRYIAPTLLEGIPGDAQIMHEEIFGPLLPIIGFNQLDEVIDRINADPKPLALYIWSRNETNIQRIMRKTSSGGACINHCVVQFLHGNLPFGGVNNSGLGSAHGEHGFLAFSHERAVVRNQVMLAKMFFPPYTNMTRRLINLFIKTV
ncbi:MAG: aldehyde dehydrogenase family protein [Pseudomonadales bacterium]|nr:aldehyde dehydrogenase family protein [Pseudomonadales bacterium]